MASVPVAYEGFCMCLDSVRGPLRRWEEEEEEERVKISVGGAQQSQEYPSLGILRSLHLVTQRHVTSSASPFILTLLLVSLSLFPS